MTVALTLTVATPAAYSLTRYRFAGRETVAATVLFAYMFAPIMIIIPFYVMMRFIGLNNTHLGLTLAYSAFCLPFALWMLRTFFQSIPVDIEDAAMVDGASRWQVVLHVVLPLALPGVVATGIFTFILAWNDYIFARVLLSADELKTLPGGDRRSLQRLGRRLGDDHGRRPAGDRAGARRVRVHPAIHGGGARLRRDEGIAQLPRAASPAASAPDIHPPAPSPTFC